MSEESTSYIIGEAALDVTQPPRRGWFGRRKKEKKTPEPLTHCENCGAALSGAYCSHCGQHAIDYHRSILRVAADAADSLLNWDSKFLVSVWLLLVRPWQLTNDFNAGRRSRFMHPLRFYLLAAIAFFWIAQKVNLEPHDGREDLTPERRAELQSKLATFTGADSAFSDEQKAVIEKVRQRLADSGALSKQERADFKTAFNPKATENPSSKSWREQRAKVRELVSDIPNATPTPASSPDPNFIGPLPQHEASPVAAKPERGIHFRAGPTPAGMSPFEIDLRDEDGNSDKPKAPFETWLEGRMKDKIGENGSKAKLFLETLRSNLPYMMLCCIPLFAFVLKILYVRQRRFYVEHLVYALHIHSFVYVAVVVIVLVNMATSRLLPALSGWILGLLIIATVVQVFLSIRRVYRDGWFFTFFKFFLGGSIYFFILVFAIATTALITIMQD